MGIQISNVVNAIVYAAIGIVIFAGAFLVSTKSRPITCGRKLCRSTILRSRFCSAPCHWAFA